MTERPLGMTGAARQPGADPARSLLSRALNRAWWALMWERVWPPLSLIATTLGIFLTVSWAGLWQQLPPLGRAIGVGLFGFALLASLWPLFRVTRPSRDSALARVDRASGIPHRPATAISDEIAGGRTDTGSLALWQAHVERARAAARSFKAGTPSPGLALRDPYAIRGLVLIMLVATFVGASGDRLRRVTSAFDWRGVVASANYRIDAWVTPPNYTGRPPVLMAGMRAGEPQREQATISAPAGSVLVIRATGVTLDVTARGLTEAAPSAGGGPATPGSDERRFAITESGSVTVRGPNGDATWNFTVIPDRAPTIAFAKDPEPQARGALLLTYRLEDDYGVTQAEAIVAPKDAVSGPKAPRPLYGAPNFPLVLPQSRTRNGVGQTSKDLSDHPWAGVEVVLTLVARDEGGNEGRSEPHVFKIPQRPFGKPLARALIEQRRILALNADAQGRVIRAMAALTTAPEKFSPEAGIYLGLRSIFHLVSNAKTDDELRTVVERLWQMAVAIEDGNVSDAELALRQAQENLRQALERGATDEELKKLMEELRAALDKFMQALAEEMRKNPQAASPLDRNARELRPQDLQNFLKRLEEAARSGAKDLARQMLSELQQMLDNLQMARPGQQGDGDDDMMSSLDELGDMIRREQQLRDRTFRQGQDQRRQQRGQRGQRGQQGQQGQQGQEGQQGQQPGDQQSMDDLRKDQQALRERLKKLLEDMRKRGQQPGGRQPGQGENGEDPLGEAEQAMRDAEDALGQGDGEGAGEAQGRAIESMRRGAQNLAQQMQQGPNGPGPNGQPGQMGRQRAQQDTDPLGRPRRSREYGDDVTVKVPGQIDVQRARRILEELRRRFSDPLRPPAELEYLERLLKDF